jgi:hypothetical protein
MKIGTSKSLGVRLVKGFLIKTHKFVGFPVLYYKIDPLLDF